jgi:hypothetical protein
MDLAAVEGDSQIYTVQLLGMRCLHCGKVVVSRSEIQKLMLEKMAPDA